MIPDTYPKVSIIVASYNSADTIKECLESILTLDYPPDHVEIIVMDGFSKDTTVKIAQQFPVKVISLPLNAPAAYNYAQKTAIYPILGFIDSDAKVEPQWLKKLVPHLSEPQVAGVSGSIETWNQSNPWARSIGYEIKNRYQRIGRYTRRIATMNLLLKKSALEEVDGWDENLPSQYDTDFGFRITKKGYKIAYEPSALCYHYNRTTLKTFYRQQLQYGKNTLKLYFKHDKLARGDEITDAGMNIQPILLLVVVLLFFLGLIPLLRILWIGPPVILLSMLLYFTYSAAKISSKFHDWSAMRLVVLYFVRAGAWFNGAVTTTLSYLLERKR
ncbi:MAG: glycosyltransferase [Nitrososphaerota archaeon]|jgi:cellulose synthase/poly-beta-1,6-N-acetylglucosamine synthase-like glycosyltransferase|nr:glycosyltransferase [Nitrososphaerota archaeon]